MLEGFRAFAPGLARKNEGFGPEYFEHLARLESGHFWFEHRNRVILWGVRRFLPQAKSFLEIGCGTGFVLSAIRANDPRSRLAGGEIHVGGLTFARRRLPGVELFQIDATSIPFESEFDAIGAFDVIEHIEQDVMALKEAHRALVPGGILFLSVPQHPFLWSAVDEHSFHKRRYQAGALR